MFGSLRWSSWDYYFPFIDNCPVLSKKIWHSREFSLADLILVRCIYKIQKKLCNAIIWVKVPLKYSVCTWNVGGKTRHFKGALAFFFTGSMLKKKKTKMFCSLPAMTLRALNESHLECAVRFRQRRSIYKELYIKSTQNRSLEKSV